MNKTLVYALALGVCVAVSYLVWSWQPERQIQAQMKGLLSAASAKNWKKAGRFLAADYRDGWGQSREEALTNAGEFGRHFLALEIQGTGEVTRTDRSALWEGKLTFQGRGTAVGEALFSRAEELKSDFVFAWYKENWKPWSWKLVSVAQPEIFFDSQWF